MTARASPQDPSDVDPRDRAVVEKRIDASERNTMLITLVGGFVTTQPWFLVDYFLERPWFLPDLYLRLFIDASVVICFLVLRFDRSHSARLTSAIEMLSVLSFGTIAIAVARAEHYEIYVLGFSMIIWGSGIILRWSARLAALTYVLLIAEFCVATVLVPGRASLVTIFGAVIYLATAAILMIANAINARGLQRQSGLMALRLEQRAVELGNALDELRITQARLVETEKLGALGRLLAGLSHEINNPINVIHNTLPEVRKDAAALEAALASLRARAAKEPLGPDDVDAHLREAQIDDVQRELEEALADVETSTARIRGIHRDLRAFVRGDAVERQATDLEAGLKSTVGMVQRSAGGKVTWKMEVAQLPQVNVHPGQVNQILFNLLQNAVDAMPEGGTVTISSAVRDGAVELAVSDTGSGVPEAIASKLFEPFFTTKPVGKGTGLGLAISRELAQRNGGTLTLAPSHGGAKFVLTLPRMVE